MNRPLSSKKNITRDSDKNLIAEQPGMVLFLSSFLAAFLVGYIAHSLLSPERVSARISMAASHINKDIGVKFENAQLSLSDGILPRLAVIITHAQMESSQVCWLAPRLEVDELRLPISFWALITGSPAIKTIEADNVHLYVTGKPEDCKKTLARDAQEKAESIQPVVTMAPSENSNNKSAGDITSLHIDNLTISDSLYPQYDSSLHDFSVKVKSTEPKIIEVNAKTQLLKDDKVGDYLSHANLHIEYKESPEPTVLAHFFGNLREGRYSVIADYSLPDHLLTVETDLKHIPLTQILALLEKYNLASKDLNGRQVWVSGKSHFTGVIEKAAKLPFDVRDVKFEGDLGDLSVDKISFLSFDPLVYKPIHVDVSHLSVENLLTLLNRSHRSKIFGGLGHFSGQADIISDQDIRLFGEHRGLEFVFSNKGERELQVIESMSGEIALKDKQWRFHVARAQPLGGVFDGELSLVADRDFHEVQIKSKVDELRFAPAVQKLMTNGGQMGAASLNAELHLQKDTVNFLKGLLRIDGMTVEGMKFGDTRSQFDWQKNEVVVNTTISDLAVAPESSAMPLLKQVLEPSWIAAGPFVAREIKGQFHLQNFKALAWRHFEGHIQKNGHMTTEGSWNENGLLQGLVQTHDGKQSHSWLIRGDRDKPQIEAVNLPSKKRGTQ